MKRNEKQIAIAESEKQSLNNALTHYDLKGYKIIQDYGSRKNVYALIDNNGTSLTGMWDYTSINHFLIGYGKAIQQFRPMTLWDKTTREERERIFDELGYAYPSILSEMLWRKLPKGAKEDFKYFFKANSLTNTLK